MTDARKHPFARVNQAQPLSKADVRHALLRSWAAAVRDRQPPYQQASDECVRLATALGYVLDTLEGRRRAGRDLLGTDTTRDMLVEALRARGIMPPA